jgi:hypothetical protein
MNTSKKKYLGEFVILFLLTLAVFNYLQSTKTLHSLKSYLYLSLHAIAFFLLVFLVFKSWKSKGVVYKICYASFNLSIPMGVKIAVLIVAAGNFIVIAIGRPNYPFYNVGMFSWASAKASDDKILYNPKYYYYKNGTVKLLDLRKESIFLFADNFGWGYTHEFTFAVTYHNKGQKENFEFIAEKMKERGVDTLWVGVQLVNYKTREVKFEPNICNAIKINNTQKIYYGPIYIPEYQKLKCESGF